jgi:hypothetical protein
MWWFQLSDLQNYFVNPGIITFENIYQAIQDISVLKSIPDDPNAFDEFRPHVGATHVLKSNYNSFNQSDSQMLRDLYLEHLLDVFLSELSNVSDLSVLIEALSHLERKYILNSFTLNYDDIIERSLRSYHNGFISEPAPKSFDQNLLLSAINKRKTIHSHLHGSLKWGFPTTRNPFELHEFDSPSDGVKASKSRPSGRPLQSGETISPSPIVTGMDKTEHVFNKVFYSNFLAMFRSFEICSILLIAGYGFSDRHINRGIEQCRINRPNVRTYIVDFNSNDHPSSFIQNLSTDSWRTLLPEDTLKAKTIKGFDGWWRIPGIVNSEIHTGPIFMWLQGFETFCDALRKHGLPK